MSNTNFDSVFLSKLKQHQISLKVDNTESEALEFLSLTDFQQLHLEFLASQTRTLDSLEKSVKQGVEELGDVRLNLSRFSKGAKTLFSADEVKTAVEEKRWSSSHQTLMNTYSTLAENIISRAATDLGEWMIQLKNTSGKTQDSVFLLMMKKHQSVMQGLFDMGALSISVLNGLVEDNAKGKASKQSHSNLTSRSINLPEINSLGVKIQVKAALVGLLLLGRSFQNTANVVDAFKVSDDALLPGTSLWYEVVGNDLPETPVKVYVVGDSFSDAKSFSSHRSGQSVFPSDRVSEDQAQAAMQRFTVRGVNYAAFMAEDVVDTNHAVYSGRMIEDLNRAIVHDLEISPDVARRVESTENRWWGLFGGNARESAKHVEKEMIERAPREKWGSLYAFAKHNFPETENITSGQFYLILSKPFEQIHAEFGDSGLRLATKVRTSSRFLFNWNLVCPPADIGCDVVPFSDIISKASTSAIMKVLGKDNNVGVQSFYALQDAVEILDPPQESYTNRTFANLRYVGSELLEGIDEEIGCWSKILQMIKIMLVEGNLALRTCYGIAQFLQLISQNTLVISRGYLMPNALDLERKIKQQIFSSFKGMNSQIQNGGHGVTHVEKVLQNVRLYTGVTINGYTISSSKETRFISEFMMFHTASRLHSLSVWKKTSPFLYAVLWSSQFAELLKKAYEHQKEVPEGILVYLSLMHK